MSAGNGTALCAPFPLRACELGCVLEQSYLRAQVLVQCDLTEVTGTFAQFCSYSLHFVQCPHVFWPSTLKEG